VSENSPTEGGLGAEPHLSETCAVDYEVLKRGGLLAARWRFVAWVSAPPMADARSRGRRSSTATRRRSSARSARSRR
jgi:hypothetical protein